MRERAASVPIKAEQLGYWYLRLNGFLTIPNFVVHPDVGPDPETDIDILGVRFPYREENLQFPMADHFRLVLNKDKSLVVITEVKKSECKLNGPWTNRERQNLPRMLSALGTFPKPEMALAAQTLYDSGVYESQLYVVSLLCLGGEHNERVARRFPLVKQILWPDVLQFIFERFSKYEEQKGYHPQWDQAGKELWRRFDATREQGLGADHFMNEVLAQMPNR
jgi:hypothetical protein